jgi:carboxylate-amine ligase
VEFNSSPEQTIGIEVEYGIVSRETGQLAPVSLDVLREAGSAYPGDEHPKAKNELFQPSLEVITGICQTPDAAVRDLAETLSDIVPLLNERGLALTSTGTHPFAEWDQFPITPDERYERMVNQIQWPAQRLLIHGVHVHVGALTPDKAIITTNVAAMYLPILLALSASSPYWLSRDTGLASSRTKIFEGMPRTGIPPQIPDWAEYQRLLAALIRSQTIETVREIWWDVRPHPNFGTVEFRMCDGITTLNEVAAVGALAQCIAVYVNEQTDAGIEIELLPDWVLRENKWRASRWGLDAELIVDDSFNTEPLRDKLSELVERLSPIAERLGCAAELNYALHIAATGASYQRQRAVVESGGTLVDVVASTVAESDRSFAEYGVVGAAENVVA